MSKERNFWTLKKENIILTPLKGEGTINKGMKRYLFHEPKTHSKGMTIISHIKSGGLKWKWYKHSSCN